MIYDIEAHTLLLEFMKKWNIFHFHILDEFNKGLMQKVGGIILLLSQEYFHTDLE